MSIAKMQMLQMIVPHGSCRELLRDLTKAGCVEVERSDDWMNEPELAGVLTRIPSKGINSKAFSEASQALDALAKYAGVKKGLLQPRSLVTETSLATEAPTDETTAAINEINSASRQIYSLASETSRLESQRLSLEPWLGCDVPLDYQTGGSFDVLFGTVPAAFEFPAVKSALDSSCDLADIELVGSGKEVSYTVLTVHSEERAKALEALKDFGFGEVSFADVHGTAEESLQALGEQLAAIEKETEELTEKIKSFAPQFEAIGKAYDYYSTQSQWDDIQASLPSTGNVSLITGWVPEGCEDTVVSIAEKRGCAYELREPEEDEEPPTLLRNGRFVEPFGQVTSLYGMPMYRSLIDPNPAVAISYFIFFGIMFSDAVYGIVLFLATLFFLRKARPDGNMKRFVTMFMLCGISTFVFGAAFGSWCGDLISVLGTRITGSPWNVPKVLDPLEEPLIMLGFSLALGVIHLYTGMFMNIKRQLARREYTDIIFDELTWMIAIPCIVLYAIGVKPCLYVAIACIAVVALTGGRANKGLGKFTGGFGAVYNGLTGNLSDILSYSRLMALALATGVVAQVMNTLGNMGGTSVFGWLFFLLVFVIGQVFNFAISILGAFVHSCRLQFVELFGRFYEGGGRDFKPLLYKTKYVEISKED